MLKNQSKKKWKPMETKNDQNDRMLVGVKTDKMKHMVTCKKCNSINIYAVRHTYFFIFMTCVVITLKTLSTKKSMISLV